LIAPKPEPVRIPVAPAAAQRLANAIQAVQAAQARADDLVLLLVENAGAPQGRYSLTREGEVFFLVLTPETTR